MMDGTHGQLATGGGRGKHCMMEEWEHFTRLQDEGYIGKSNFFYAVCHHCQRAYDEAPDDKKPLMLPERMVGRREKMRKHLSLCPHFKGELPALERRLPMPIRPGLGAFLPQGLGAALTGGTASLLDAQTTSVEGNAVAAAAAAAAVAAAASAASAGSASSSSSRLALDEWQYFTRLHRKKDSAYYYARCNFCQLAYDNAPESMRASMEPAIVMGRKSNMQTHLSKCIHVPKELFAQKSAAAAAGYSLAAAVAAAVEAGDAASAEAFSSLAKRMKLDAAASLFGQPGLSLDASIALPDPSELGSALVEFLIQNRLPFEWIETSSAKKLFRLFVRSPEGADTLIPTAANLRTKVLDELCSKVAHNGLDDLRSDTIPPMLSTTLSAIDNETSRELLTAWPVSFRCSLLTPSGLLGGMLLVPKVQYFVSNGKVSIPLVGLPNKDSPADASSCDAAGSESTEDENGDDEASEKDGSKEESDELLFNHGLDLARVLDKKLRQCSINEKLWPAVAIMPCSPIADRAAGILRSRWQRVAFVTAFNDLLDFALLKTLATTEVFTTVSSLVDLWQQQQLTANGSVLRSAVAQTNPFKGWTECASLMELLLEPSTFSANEQLKAAVDAAVDWDNLKRVHSVLQAFVDITSTIKKNGFLSLSNSLAHLGAIFRAASGFDTVERVLEVIWAQLEQPLFLVAHALDPNLRTDGLNNTDLTKLSVLSDLSVNYFTSFFGRKASSLRGEVTAYLHVSQPHFSRAFVAEFPVIESYYLYLSDDYPALSVFMRLLQSLSPVGENAGSSINTDSSLLYSADEQAKLAYLKEAWQVTEGPPPTSSAVAATSAVTSVDIVAPSATSGLVVDEWKEALEKRMAARSVDVSRLESEFESPVDAAAAMLVADVITSEISKNDKLPAVPAFSDEIFPSTPLAGLFAKKVTLKELFSTSSIATI